jgi:hypothetical protein
MVQEGDEVCDCALKVNIVFPQGVIGVDHQRLSRCFQSIVQGHTRIV